MNDPLSSLEEAHQQRSLGALAVNVYVGALAECESKRVAFWATVALLVASFNANEQREPEE